LIKKLGSEKSQTLNELRNGRRVWKAMPKALEIAAHELLSDVQNLSMGGL
jgi:hypothetical protein